MSGKPTLEELREALKIPEIKYKTDRLGRITRRNDIQIEKSKIDHAFSRNPRKGRNSKWR